MFGLTSLGTVHTVLSLIAVVAGVTALARHGAIRPTSRDGLVYIVATVLTCLTGLGIYQHGGFGKPHVLSIVTLLVLGVTAWARASTVFGSAWQYVEVLGNSLTLFFHMVPGVAETASRLPMGHPLVSGAEDPRLQPVFGVLFVVYLLGVGLQAQRLRRLARRSATPVWALRKRLDG